MKCILELIKIADIFFKLPYYEMAMWMAKKILWHSGLKSEKSAITNMFTSGYTITSKAKINVF